MEYPKKHIEKLEELTKNERDEMFDIVDKTIKTLRENNICDRIIKNIGTILDYAKKNFRTRDVYEQINQITKIVKKYFASKKYN